MLISDFCSHQLNDNWTVLVKSFLKKDLPSKDFYHQFISENKDSQVTKIFSSNLENLIYHAPIQVCLEDSTEGIAIIVYLAIKDKNSSGLFNYFKSVYPLDSLNSDQQKTLSMIFNLIESAWCSYLLKFLSHFQFKVKE